MERPGSSPTVLRARFVFTGAGPPIPDGLVTIAGDRIVDIGRQTKGLPIRDLGPVAIVPGLVNAHTHLEFSTLDQPLGIPGGTFPDWIQAIVDWRRDLAAHGEWEMARDRAVAEGLRQCGSAGVTLVGDIATSPGPPAMWLAEANLSLVSYFELLGLSPDRWAGLVEPAQRHLGLHAAASRRWQPGLSPHAPYSIRLDALEQACRWSAEYRVPLAMHLAESFEERELLASGSGPLRELLERLGAWHPTAIPRGLAIQDYLERLGSAHRALIVHGNYLTSTEIDWLASRADRLAVVYCPRTHAYFGHESHPLESLLAAGVRVALGTDSRASNPDLDLWSEVQFVAARYPQLDPAALLRMATLNGAWALNQDAQSGNVQLGMRADLTVISLPDDGSADPYAALFHTSSRVVGSCLAGTWRLGTPAQ